MKYLKTVSSLIFIFGLTGCGAKYILEGKQYDSIEAMREARDLSWANDRAQITSLPQPVSNKQLVVAEASKDLKFKRMRARAERQLGRPATDAEHNDFISKPLTQFNYEATDIPEVVRKKGIYKSVEAVTFDSEIEIPASSERDVIQLEDGQWVFRGYKTGRQLLTFDNSKKTRVERLNGMLDQIISAAILNKSQ